MFSGHDVPVIFPSINSTTRHLRPSTGSLGRLSLLHRYHEVLRLAVHLPASLRSSRRSAVLQRPSLQSSRRLPGSWATLASRATLSDPGGILMPWSLRTSTASGLHCSRQLSLCFRAPVSHSDPSRCLAASRHKDAAFRYLNDVGSHNLILTGLNHAAHSLAVYASQKSVARHHARLASGW